MRIERTLCFPAPIFGQTSLQTSLIWKVNDQMKCSNVTRDFRKGCTKSNIIYLNGSQLSGSEQDFSIWPFRTGPFGLAVSDWPIRSGRFGHVSFGETMKSWRNLTLMQSRNVWFKAHSLHHVTIVYQMSRHTTQSVLLLRFAIAASACGKVFYSG